MDFSLTDDQRLIRDTVRQFMDVEVRPTIRSRDREEKFASAELRKLGELGCCGMMIPESQGGAGADTISYVLMLEDPVSGHAQAETVLGHQIDILDIRDSFLDDVSGLAH